MRYCMGLDLHSNNTYLEILDEEGTKVYKTKRPNHLRMILSALWLYQKSIVRAVLGCMKVLPEKALAPKLARVSHFIIRDRVDCNPKKTKGCP